MIPSLTMRDSSFLTLYLIEISNRLGGCTTGVILCYLIVSIPDLCLPTYFYCKASFSYYEQLIFDDQL